MSKNLLRIFFLFFVLTFIILALVRTLGDFVFVNDNLLIYWTEFLATSKKLSVYLILCAMVALGLQTDLKGMMSLGIKPLVIGFSAAVIVGLVSVILSFNAFVKRLLIFYVFIVNYLTNFILIKILLV